MNRLIRNIVFVVIYLASHLYGQSAIFPGLQGEELLDSLVVHYKPVTTLTQSQTKDTMYALIYNHNDSLSCVYTDYTMYIDPSQDPSQAAFNNGEGINQEHTWPRSKGAGSGNAERDMHHLFPTRVDVNGARDSRDFDEIPDALTDSWWWLDFSTPVIPSENIEEYSELDVDGQGRFEPREEFKGNVARAMFYFFTMYKQEALNSSDPGFFDRQKDVLRNWHALDPADADELSRTNQIAAYQDGKANPFILDATLVNRAYFESTGIDDGKPALRQASTIHLYQNYPNPFNPQTSLSFKLVYHTDIELIIFDATGKKIRTLLRGAFPPGFHLSIWNGMNDLGNPVSSGIYFYQLRTDDMIQSKKMILIR